MLTSATEVNPKNPAKATFYINGGTYTVSNIVMPSGETERSSIRGNSRTTVWTLRFCCWSRFRYVRHKYGCGSAGQIAPYRSPGHHCCLNLQTAHPLQSCPLSRSDWKKILVIKSLMICVLNCYLLWSSPTDFMDAVAPSSYSMKCILLQFFCVPSTFWSSDGTDNLIIAVEH